jgi:hypothetical protein
LAKTTGRDVAGYLSLRWYCPSLPWTEPVRTKKKRAQSPVKVKSESIIQDILDRKRSFSEVDQEYDWERELASQGLEQLEELEREELEREEEAQKERTIEARKKPKRQLTAPVDRMSTLRQKRQRSYK